MSELTADDVELTVIKELEELLPAHTKQEAEEFRKSVEEKGRFDEAIAYWGPQHAIIDGHQRFRLWESLPENTPIPPPRVREELFPDIAAVKKWMIRRQLGRRNLTEKGYSVLRGRLYNESKSPPGQPAKELARNRANSFSAAEAVATETNSAPATVRADGAFVESLDAIGAVNGKAKSDIETGSLKVSKSDVTKIGKLDRDGIGAAIKNLRNGRKWNDGLTPRKPAKATADLAEAYMDDERNEVPESLFPVWRARDTYMKLAGKCKSLAGEIDELRKSPAGRFPAALSKSIDDAGKALALAMPSVVSGRSWKPVAEAGK